MHLDKKDGKELIRLAKESIESSFSREDVKISKAIKDRYSSNQGVFVTLNIKEKLRGCIGFPEPIMHLYSAVIEAAKSAAFSDSRFSPLTKEEFPKIKIEISVLSVPSLIKVNNAKEYLDKIKIGSDGLIIRGKYCSGLLLPQVFIEYDCDVIKALEMLCQKAGLLSNAWKDCSNKIYKFQAQIFHES
jgi:uncharacterized protein